MSVADESIVARDGAVLLWRRSWTVFTKLRVSSLLRVFSVEVNFACWAFWRASLSLVVAPVAVREGVSAWMKKLFMTI